ncbi:hypothetical protein GA0061105_108127 [Rhizobium aethiopicum]|uniref:Uncharacterized protein n=1 Tax=Rhizobium aethiopicum TaxID=1138170 RepID=A0A1C3Y5Q9_9HYPH|nr:hypothetical protein GA0061105_108127 [Rhizobium aethiopicum]
MRLPLRRASLGGLGPPNHKVMVGQLDSASIPTSTADAVKPLTPVALHGTCRADNSQASGAVPCQLSPTI